MSITFVIEEVEGDTPIQVVLSGGLLPAVGAELSTEQRGGKYVPIGASAALQTVNALDFGDTELTIYPDAAFFGPDDFQVTGVQAPITPEGVLGVLEAIASRGRAVNVRLGPFDRIGVLRRVATRPTRGYTVDPSTGEKGNAGVNLEIDLKFEWSRVAAPLLGGAGSLSGASAAGALSAASSKIAAGLADAADLSTSALDAINGVAGKLNKAVAQLRRDVKGIGDLARLPATAGNKILASARAVGNVFHDLDNLASDMADDQKILGGNIADVAKVFGAKRSLGKVREGANDAAETALKVIDAIERRRRRSVGVHPGDSLAAIAKAQLGTADRWQEIAQANNLPGQTVPAGVFELELPPG